MKKILTNLFKIKSMMTICVMLVFSVLALNGSMPIEVTASIITAVTTYYFTKEPTGVDAGELDEVTVEKLKTLVREHDNKSI